MLTVPYLFDFFTIGAESQSDMPADRFMSFLREGGADAESGNESPLSCGAFFGDNEESSKTEAGEKILASQINFGNKCMYDILIGTAGYFFLAVCGQLRNSGLNIQTKNHESLTSSL